MSEQVTTNDLEVALELATDHQRRGLEELRGAIGPGDAVDFTWPEGTEGELVLTAGERELRIPPERPGPSPLDQALDRIEFGQEPSAATAAADEPARMTAPPCDECGQQLPMHSPGCSRRPVAATASREEQARIDRSIDGDAEGSAEPEIVT